MNARYATPAAQSPAFEPVRLVEIDLAQPLLHLESRQSPIEQAYRKALVFVRLHSEPLGLVEMILEEDGSLGPDDQWRTLWPAVAKGARHHLACDGIGVPDVPAPMGIEHTRGTEPHCVAERLSFLRQAPKLTVLVPTRERPERLQRCLNSILASDYPAECIELIIVDNAPETEATRLLVESYGDRAHIRYFREDATGSASARNRGLRAVETEVVVMTDDDTVVDRHWLTQMARAFDSFPQAAAVSGLTIPLELDTAPQIWFEQYGGFSRGFTRRVLDLDKNQPSDVPLFPWTTRLFGSGNNFAFRSAFIREIGGFDAALGNGTPALGGVDTEILLRTVLLGHSIVYEPSAVVHHAHRPDYASLRRQIYDFGAGIIACHMKTFLANPRLLPQVAMKVPRGLRFALSSSSSKNFNKRGDYPRELTWLDRRGMLYGPIGYALSRRKYGPHVCP